jgi:hypothetical protein
MCLTGSCLVLRAKPKDRDIVCLFKSAEEVNEFAQELGSDQTFYGENSPFISLTDGNINYICTDVPEFFYRFKAYSGVLDRLQLTDKGDRVEIAKAALYWESPEVSL